jgi:hypothetical protein
MAKNKFLITAKQDTWGGLVKKGESIILESNGNDRPYGSDLYQYLKNQGKTITSSSDTLVPQTWDIKKL